METLVIQGGIPLRGRVRVGGAKNAALPIMAACLAVDGPCLLENVPDLADVRTLAEVMTRLGMEVTRRADGALVVETRDDSRFVADYELVGRMRASICVLGPLLGRRRQARVALPGGCRIGHRPIDLHLKGLEALGADIRIEHGDIIASAPRLRGAEIDLAGPCGSTVTGTGNVMTAAVFAEGRTVIRSAAQEPEVVDLANFLNARGARIAGHGTATIEIIGTRELVGGTYAIIPDRIEAATLVIAAAMTGGSVTIEAIRAADLTAVLDCARAIGIRIDESQPGELRVLESPRLQGIEFIARPFPDVPTDVQAQLSALLCMAEGRSVVEDAVFPDRFLHLPELQRMGARVVRDGNRTIITGIPRLSGAEVRATDLRASAALVLAGLAAEGRTVIHDVHHLDRGYERLDLKLANLGANICRSG